MVFSGRWERYWAFTALRLPKYAGKPRVLNESTSLSFHRSATISSRHGFHSTSYNRSPCSLYLIILFRTKNLGASLFQTTILPCREGGRNRICMASLSSSLRRRSLWKRPCFRVIVSFAAMIHQNSFSSPSKSCVFQKVVFESPQTTSLG